MSAANNSPTIQETQGVAETSHSSPGLSPPIIAASESDPAMHEVTYAKGKPTKHLPGLSLVGEPEIKVTRACPKVVKTQERPRKSSSGAPTKPNAVNKTFPSNQMSNPVAFPQAALKLIAQQTNEQSFADELAKGSAPDPALATMADPPGQGAADALRTEAIPPVSNAPATKASNVPAIYRGSDSDNNGLSQSVLSDIANRIFSAAKEG